MKQVESDKVVSHNKQALCHEIEQLHAEVNQLAVRLSTYQGHEIDQIWKNLAQARAYLATALEASRQLRADPHPISYEI